MNASRDTACKSRMRMSLTVLTPRHRADNPGDGVRTATADHPQRHRLPPLHARAAGAHSSDYHHALRTRRPGAKPHIKGILLDFEPGGSSSEAPAETGINVMRGCRSLRVSHHGSALSDRPWLKSLGGVRGSSRMLAQLHHKNFTASGNAPCRVVAAAVSGTRLPLQTEI